MPFYDLRIVDQHSTLATVAKDRSEALAIFGTELGLKLAMANQGAVDAPYLLDEWEIGPHWVNPTLPVKISN